MKIALIQFRSNQDIIEHEIENYLDKTGLDREELIPLNIYENNFSNIEINDYDAYIFGGSGEILLSEKEPETLKLIKKVTPLIKKIIKGDKLSLFVCFGHQLLAHTLGFEIKSDERQSEVGTIDLKLTKEGMKDPISKNMTKKFKSQSGHNDIVSELPTNCVLLATNDTCKIQMYKLKTKIYSTQFHPEHNKFDLIQRLNFLPNYIKDGMSFGDNPQTRLILKNFVDMV